jgi:hypothetical protein
MVDLWDLLAIADAAGFCLLCLPRAEARGYKYVTLAAF